MDFSGQVKDTGPFENGAELHAEMEEASAKAMAIIEGAAKFTEEVEQQNVERPKPDEVRTKREIQEESKVRAGQIKFYLRKLNCLVILCVSNKLFIDHGQIMLFKVKSNLGITLLLNVELNPISKNLESNQMNNSTLINIKVIQL